MDEWTDGWTEGWMGGAMDHGGMDGRRDGCMYGWMAGRALQLTETRCLNGQQLRLVKEAKQANEPMVANPGHRFPHCGLRPLSAWKDPLGNHLLYVVLLVPVEHGTHQRFPFNGKWSRSGPRNTDGKVHRAKVMRWEAHKSEGPLA